MNAISEKIKRCVEFRNINLLRDPFPWDMDIIPLCRNVLIYFTEEAKEYLFEELSKSLAPNGNFIHWKYRADYQLPEV